MALVFPAAALAEERVSNDELAAQATDPTASLMSFQLNDWYPQDPIDGTSLAYTFKDAQAPTRKKVQYFDNNGSRAIYQDGWVAATFGPLVPWLPGAPGLAEWDSAKDRWALYDITTDFSEATDLAAKDPKRLAQLQKTFDQQATANQVCPLGGGHLAAPAPRGSHQDAVHQLAVRRHHDAHARVHCTGSGA